MAVVRPRAEDVATLICESCCWTEPKSSLVIEMWTRVMGKDFCDLEAIPQGENCRRGAKAKLTWDDVDRIRAMAGTISQNAIGRQFGIDGSQVCRILSGQAWTERKAA